MVASKQKWFMDEISHTLAKTMYNVGGGDTGAEYLAFAANRIDKLTNLIMATGERGDEATQRNARLTHRAVAKTVGMKIDVSGLNELHGVMKRTRQFRTILRNFFHVYDHASDDLVSEFKLSHLYPIYHEFKQKLIDEGRWNPPTLYLDDKPQGERP